MITYHFETTERGWQRTSTVHNDRRASPARDWFISCSTIVRMTDHKCDRPKGVTQNPHDLLLCGQTINATDPKAWHKTLAIFCCVGAPLQNRNAIQGKTPNIQNIETTDTMSDLERGRFRLASGLGPNKEAWKKSRETQTSLVLNVIICRVQTIVIPHSSTSKRPSLALLSRLLLHSFDITWHLQRKFFICCSIDWLLTSPCLPSCPSVLKPLYPSIPKLWLNPWAYPWA